MPNIRKILCPTDLQSTSREALLAANQLAAHYEAELLVLHVVPSFASVITIPLANTMLYAAPGYEEEMKRHAKKNLDHALREVLPATATARALVTMGSLRSEITRVAECEGCDLIVMEAHDAPGLGAYFFGTTCEAVLRHSSIPVWLARPAVHARHAVDDPNSDYVTKESPRELEPLHIRKILCPTDGSEPARAALQIAREMALDWHAELCVLHVYESAAPVLGLVSHSSFDDDLKREAKELIERETAGFADAGVSLRPLIRAGAAAPAILEAIGEEQPDLTIIATHGYSGWKRLTMGSVAEPVARLASCAVMTVHQTSEESEATGEDKKAAQFFGRSGPVGEPKAEAHEKQSTSATISSPISSLSPKPVSIPAKIASDDLDADSAWKVNADDFPSQGTREEKSRFVLQYAILAPSNRNTQPWLWRITEDGLELYADTSRSLPKVDPQGRELFIACGAALFNLRVALRHLNCEFETHLLPAPNAPDLLARVPITFPTSPDYYSGSAGMDAIENASLFADITRRHTHRGDFTERAPDAELHIQLKEAAREEGALLRFVEADERERVAELVKRATIFQASDPWLRHEWEKWIRSAPETRKDGLQRESLGMGADEKPSDYDSFVGRAARDREAVGAAPTLILLETEGDAPGDWLNAGAALQHVLLLARAHDVFASYFNQVIEVTDVWRTLRNQLGLLCHPQLLFRLGFPVAPDAVFASPRRPVEEVVTDDVAASRALGEYVSSRNRAARLRH